MKKLSLHWKWLVPALLILFGAVCFVLLAGSGWAFSRFGRTPTPTREPVAFGYCGARLDKLCVVSFGRDALGGTLINLFVPLKQYPGFYLKVITAAGEQRYECFGNKVIKTSVYCVGKPLILGEGLEIRIHATLDDQLVAQGAFTLTAFLVSTPAIEDVSSTETPAIFTEETTATLGAFDDVLPTSTDNFFNGTSEPTPTLTPTSHPSYP